VRVYTTESSGPPVLQKAQTVTRRVEKPLLGTRNVALPKSLEGSVLTWP
jgi:hypothetical protein